jgi:hypothetical protein
LGSAAAPQLLLRATETRVGVKGSGFPGCEFFCSAYCASRISLDFVSRVLQPMYATIISLASYENLHADIAVTGCEEAADLSCWFGTHPRLGRVVAVQGSGDSMVLITERPMLQLVRGGPGAA